MSDKEQITARVRGEIRSTIALCIAEIGARTFAAASVLEKLAAAEALTDTERRSIVTAIARMVDAGELLATAEAGLRV